MTLDRVLEAAKPENVAKRVRERLERNLLDPAHARMLRDRFVKALEGKVVTREEMYPDSKK
jgi:hypothetical protein